MTSDWNEILSLRNITQFPLVSGVSDSRLSHVYPLM